MDGSGLWNPLDAFGILSMPLESFGCLWIQASLHENAKILKHRTLALSEELKSQGADMGGQHPIGTLRRMRCTPHHLVSHGDLSWH